MNISNGANCAKAEKKNHRPILEHVQTLESNLGKLSSGIVKGFDDFFAPVHIQQPTEKFRSQPRKSPLNGINKEDTKVKGAIPVVRKETPDIDIFSSSILDVLKDIGKDVGNAGKDLTKGAYGIIRQPAALADKIRLGNSLFFSKDDAHIKLRQNQEPKLIEMDPCEFELSTTANHSPDELEFDDSEMDSSRGAVHVMMNRGEKKVLAAEEKAVLVAGSVGVIHHSNGRYHMTVSEDAFDEKADVSPNKKSEPVKNNNTGIVLEDYSDSIATSPTYFNDFDEQTTILEQHTQMINNCNDNIVHFNGTKNNGIESNSLNANGEAFDEEQDNDDNGSISTQDDQECCV